MFKKNTKMVSPKGKAMWAKLLKPDTKFNPDGLYSMDFIIGADDAQAMVDAIEKEVKIQYQIVAEDLKKKGKVAEVKKIRIADKPFTEVVDEAGNPTGELKFKFKLKATGKTKDGSTFTQKPVIFDAEGTEVSIEVRNNSIVKVAFEIVPFFTALIGVGTSLRLKAVQVIELPSASGGAGANSFGFKKEEGFVVSEEKQEAQEQISFSVQEELEDTEELFK